MSNLKRIRETAGLSQSQLAKAATVNINSIQGYEQGERDINKAQALTLYQIAKVLKVNMEDLLEIKKEAHP